MKNVFKKSRIASIELNNRIIRSATFENLSDKDGRPTEKLANLYMRLAKGGAGAIITGLIGVHSKGRSSSRMCMLDSDAAVEDYRKINKMLKEYNVPLIAQFAHGGGQISGSASGGYNLAPSKKFYTLSNKFSQVLSEDDIREIIESFVDAIERAKKAGFAGAQIHAAHGYLLSEFLTGGLNRRKDKWGGSTENRFRIVAEIMKGARERVGDYPILAKFSAYDNLKNGIRGDEAVRLAVMFQDAGVDALEVSCGANDGLNTIRAPKVPSEAIAANTLPIKFKSAIMNGLVKKVIPLAVKRYEPLHNYNVDIAAKIKQSVDIPVMVVGGIRNINDISAIIDEKKADYVSMCRPFIIEADIVNKFKSGKQETSKCIDCCYCMFGEHDKPLKCYYGKLKKQ